MNYYNRKSCYLPRFVIVTISLLCRDAIRCVSTWESGGVLSYAGRNLTIHTFQERKDVMTTKKTGKKEAEGEFDLGIGGNL